jgi:hypothetical protein
MTRRSWASDKFRHARRREAVQAKVSRPPPEKTKQALRSELAELTKQFLAWRREKATRRQE